MFLFDPILCIYWLHHNAYSVGIAILFLHINIMTIIVGYLMAGQSYSNPFIRSGYTHIGR